MVILNVLHFYNLKQSFPTFFGLWYLLIEGEKILRAFCHVKVSHLQKTLLIKQVQVVDILQDFGRFLYFYIESLRLSGVQEFYVSWLVTRAAINDYFHVKSISCLVCKMVKNVLFLSTAQRYSVHCHRCLKKPVLYIKVFVFKKLESENFDVFIS